MKNKEKILRNEINKDIIAILIPLFVILTIELTFKVGNLGVSYIFWGEERSIVFSILIGYLIYGILIGITKKTINFYNNSFYYRDYIVGNKSNKIDIYWRTDLFFRY